jgi:nucleoside-diphosphate-sugar epimerase
MKIIIVGATGAIGSTILTHVLRREEVTHVIALTRTRISTDAPKLSNIVVPDFSAFDSLPDSSWAELVSADAVVWAAGTYDVNADVNLHYPLGFQRAFVARLRGCASAPRTVRFALLSGAFVVRDQGAALWWMQAQRQQKGELENATLALAEENEGVWEAYVFRPAWVMFGGDAMKNRAAECMLGSSMAIRAEELAAFVAELVVNGREKRYIENADMVPEGRKLLAKYGVTN